MTHRTPASACWALVLFSSPLLAQGRSSRPPEAAARPIVPKLAVEEPVVTHHRVQAGERALSYTATAGFLPIGSESGEVEARMFFVAYTLDDAGSPAGRPVTFFWQGGPGSPAALLHLTLAGPRRIKMLPDGGMPAPPFRLVDNESTWLPQTDLVFVDPVGTGYSRAATPELNQKFWDVQGDIAAMAEFIRVYLLRFGRWDSPVFILGESYGGIRAGGVAGYLADRNVALNGVFLVSAAMSFHSRSFSPGNDLPYPLFLPTYTATAAFHGKLAPELEADLQKTLREVERWAETDYTVALMKGDRLPPEERRAAVAKLARYTGLSEAYADKADLRIEINGFRKELLRDERRTVGRVDSRWKGIDRAAVADSPEYDPGFVVYAPPVTAMIYTYLRDVLGVKSDLVYEYYGYRNTSMNWNYGPARSPFRDVNMAESLRSALARNPHLRVFVAEGYYDLAVPYFSMDYTLSHMGLDPSQRTRVQVGRYPAGHSMYVQDESRVRLAQDAARFITGAAADRPAR
jgi:carboxypeptidase C (cathepsin A)